MKKGIEQAIILELILFGASGVESFVAIIFPICYSLLMYKEFYIGKHIRPHLTTYAVSHTVVTVLLSLAIFCSLTKSYPWQLKIDLFYFALMSWGLFNIFELGRKMYQPVEEREGVPTYSNIWGKTGAVLLVGSQAVLGAVLLWEMRAIRKLFLVNFLVIALGSLALVSFFYLIRKNRGSGKIYRFFSSFYIVIVYLGIILHFFWLKL